MGNDAAHHSDIRARPLTTHLGAEIHGVDLSRTLSDAQFACILEFFHRHCVIFFRDQVLDAAQLAAFSARFGELDVHHMTEHTLPGLPQVRVLSNVKKDGKAIGISYSGMHWHSDLSYKEKPGLATLLYALECPPTGADTQFVSMYAAYEALPAERRHRLAKLQAVHDRNYRYSSLYPDRPPLSPEQIAKVPPVVHPLVVQHPVTGRATLFVAKEVVSGVVGMEAREARHLIDELEAFATRPEFMYSHKWRVGDVLVWDNRCTLHRATPFETRYRRTLYRTQVRGAAPVAAQV
jgi:taurine dioxygenase